VGNIAKALAERIVRSRNTQSRKRSPDASSNVTDAQLPPSAAGTIVDYAPAEASMTAVLADLRFGARMLTRHPAFTSLAVLTPALGIGATTTIFSLVNGVLLQPLPYRDSDRLVVVSVLPPGSSASIAVTPGDFVDWQTLSRSFDAMTAFTASPLNLTDAG